jgi:Flp pilus assembly protein CpaB
VKKKSPPYAIIGAVVLGLVAIMAFAHWKSVQDQAAAQKLADMQKQMQDQIDALNAKPAVTVTPTNPDMRPVLYATQPVQAGQKISSAFYEKKLTPNDVLPDAYSGDTDIVGFYAVRDIEKGDALTPRNIGKSLPYLSQRISPGMRALALPIFNAQVNDTGGFAVDGDKVDLLFTSTLDGIELKTEFVLQNVPILYIPGPKIESDQVNGITPAPPPGDPISVTFEVTPEQAQALIFMSQAKEDHGGHFSMILRSRIDKSEIKVKPFDSETYAYEWQKVQRMVDKSELRVQDLAQQIEAQAKAQGQGTTNETPNPTPPTP